MLPLVANVWFGVGGLVGELCWFMVCGGGLGVVGVIVVLCGLLYFFYRLVWYFRGYCKKRDLLF